MPTIEIDTKARTMANRSRIVILDTVNRFADLNRGKSKNEETFTKSDARRRDATDLWDLSSVSPDLTFCSELRQLTDR